MNKFLLISQVYYPDEVSTANLFTNLCSKLVKENIDVEVWCAQPSYTNLKKQPSLLFYNKIKIRFLPSTQFPKSNLLGRLMNYLTFSISLSCRLLISRDKTKIFTHTTPPTLGILIAFICSIKKRPFVYILLDIFPYGLIKLEKVSGKNVFISIWKKLKLYALRKSNKIIVIGRDMKEWLGVVYKEGLSKTEYIPLWQDDSLIYPIDFNKNSFILKNNLQDKFVVQYSGNMGLWNDMKTFGLAAKQLSDNSIYFFFIGDGMRKNELSDVFEDSLPPNVSFLPFQSNNKLGVILSACHIALISLREGLEGMAVPSKIYGIMAAGIPSIAMVPENSEIALIIKEENCGYVVKPSDVSGLIAAILKLKQDLQTRQIMGKNARIAFEQKYTTKIIAKKYKKIIEKA
ncbi:MAG: glycosyltransferase family 4 protein [Bacteroidales bacterium]|nr:glycosyltransferase family 4 protein [Bacteroidales bacterium]